MLTHLNSFSLVSLVQLCDDNCKMLLDRKSLYVVKNKELILRGHRNQNDGLWDIPM